MILDRKNKLLIGLVAAAALLVGKLFYIQIIEDRYKTDSIKNAMVPATIYPTRGVIHDRNGNILAGNEVAYDLMVTPREVGEFDTVQLAQALQVEPELIRSKMNEYQLNRRKIGYQSQVMIKQMSPERYLRFKELEHQFPGFFGQARSIRQYPFNAGGNLLGYVSEVDQNFLDKHTGQGYSSGDYAGKTGIEAAREADLKGIKGYQIYLRNVHNKRVSRYKDGAEDVEAVPGRDITTTIDAELQKYGQELMRNKVGSVVAIEPSTGEILALVSSPGIDVDVLADIGKHYNDIAENPYKPLYNRAVQASYPPGSCFKVVNCLIGLQEGVLTPQTAYPCSMGYHFGNRKLGCHAHRSPLNMEESIMMSCNGYYCYVLRSLLDNKKYKGVDEALDKWKEYVSSFGFGRKLGSDFPSELSGFIPDGSYYNKRYGKKHWNSLTVISLSIGQGEILCTPMHLANFCATIANRGWYKTPHIIRESEGVEIDPKYYEKNYTMVDTLHFPKVVRGMWKAVNSGFGSGGTASIAAVEGLDICGKTGTAQNPHGSDHSVFMCFAPMDNPKIAIAAYIENGGFGATYAAPIASLMVEKYLNGEVERTDLDYRMRTAYLLDRVKVRKK
ncbi:MAG: penicillin-binding protein 2 [Bacteroidales bacterium]|nr:penicillin-binding protein 2 [Bacteroidales bacterium]